MQTTVDHPHAEQSALLAGAVRELGELPVLDRTVTRLLALCRDDDSSTTEMIATLENDPTFAANLLRFANSAAAARPVRVKTIRQAVMMTGRDRIGRLAVEAATCRFLERAAGNGRSSVGLMHVHASAVASCSLELAQRAGAAAEVAHLAGLLHDIGKLVMPLAFGERAMDEISARAPAGPERVRLEQRQFGCDHALAGAMVAEASRLDTAVVTAILEHHGSGEAPAPETACVQLANALVGMLMGIDPDPETLELALASLGMDASVLDQLVAHAGQLGAGPAAMAPADGALASKIATLERQASIDELTGLANRRHWREQAREMVSAAGSSLLMCDIDRFKLVNDRNGHETGDLVLSEVARILSHHGLAGRLGGDELVLLVAGGAERALAKAQLILEQVREAFPPGAIAGWQAGVSIGVASPTAQRAGIGELLKAADDALYEAKRGGRHRFVVAP
jgi:diguanylate cyclase (GGDEF)-like protein/putative nucleotidyltransferase with HDIG domain